MRLALTCLLLVGCGSEPATNLLCAYCEIDAHCFGNPCFQDISGQRFCGKPCDSGCPAGFSCQLVNGSNSSGKTCFPDTEACMPQNPMMGQPDLSVAAPPDLANADLAPQPLPVGGPVGPTGGTVDRLFFGFTGDTRPDQCDGPYPQALINNIFTQLKNKNVQFAVDQGDHMFNCVGQFSGARTQMNAYLAAGAILGKTVFMTMGNHECTGEASKLCTLTSYGNNANYTAFVEALQKIGIDKPYYRFDVTTKSGLAVFIVVADDVWDAAEETWLTQQLTDADQHAKYTFVSKHHPDGNTDHPEFQQIYDLVRQHKYTLFFTGHTHEYRRQRSDPRAVVVGIGGAPLGFSGGYWGYGTALQGQDDRIYVTVYDQATGNVMDSFNVSPQ
jgi:calcineurin-like phosphoesterase family protein